MANITLNDITSGYNVARINANFAKLQEAINSTVLQRQNGNNTMSQSLDMNGFKIFNYVSDLTDNSSLVTAGDYNALNDKLVSLQAGVNSGFLGYATKALMDADLTHPAGTVALVTNDPTVTNNTSYRFSGGVWVPSVDRYSIITQSYATPTGSSLVGYKQNGTSATNRTVLDKLKETISVRDFGAVGNSVTDDTAAIQAAVNYALSLGGGELDFGYGSFLITAPIVLNFTGNAWLRIKGRGKGTRLTHAANAALFTSPSTISNLDVSDMWIYSTTAKTDDNYAAFYFPNGIGNSTFSNIQYYPAGAGQTGRSFFISGQNATIDTVYFNFCTVYVTGIGYQIGPGSSIFWVGGRILGTSITGTSTGVLFCGGNGGCVFTGVDFGQHQKCVRIAQLNGTSNREISFTQSGVDASFTGISVEDSASYTVITSCWAGSCDNACIAYSATSDAAWMNISGGTISNAGPVGGSGTGLKAGLVKTNKGRLLMTGVTVKECKFAGVYYLANLSAVYDKISDCQFYDNGNSTLSGSLQAILSGRVEFTNNQINVSSGGAGAVGIDPGSSNLIRCRGNVGFSGKNVVTPPAMPASGSVVTNTTGMWARVYIVGGVVNIVAVNGDNVINYSPVQAANNTIWLAPGDTVAIAYSTAPTWYWYFE